MVARKKAAKKASKARKKPVRDKSSIALQDQLSHPIQTIYSLLVLMGVAENPGDIQTRYSGNGYDISIALPLIKYGIAFSGDDYQPLIEDGWHIEKMSYRDVEPFSRVFFAIDNARLAEMYSRADPNVKNTSIPEERLLIEMKRRRMPEPDRNYRFTRDDGTELTVPDFTWEEYNLVFFMDGSYWHSIKDDQAIIKEIKSSRKMQDSIVEKRKDKVRKDGAIRSELSARGWTVLSCTDDDIETTEGLNDVVDMISRAMETIASVKKMVTEQKTGDQVPPHGSQDDDIMDMLSSNGSDHQDQDGDDKLQDTTGSNNQGDSRDQTSVLQNEAPAEVDDTDHQPDDDILAMLQGD